MPCKGLGVWMVHVVPEVLLVVVHGLNDIGGSMMSIVDTGLRASCSATTEQRVAPTHRRCTVLGRVDGHPHPRGKGGRSSGGSTAIVLRYSSWVSLYRVGRQVRVDLEGVTEDDSVLAGGPADGLAGGSERHPAVGSGPRLGGAGYCAVPLWTDAPSPPRHRWMRKTHRARRNPALPPQTDLDFCVGAPDGRCRNSQTVVAMSSIRDWVTGQRS